LKIGLSAPTNNNDIVTKQYIDDLTIDNIYVLQPQLPPIDGAFVDTNDSLLVQKYTWMIYLIHSKILKIQLIKIFIKNKDMPGQLSNYTKNFNKIIDYE
jgi:hypothetical protein